MSMDLETLVKAAGSGDADAWETLVRRFSGLIYGVCRGFRLDETDSADVVQTVWLRLAERIRSLQQPDRVGAWLVTTTKNECLALLRSRDRFEVAEFENLESGAMSPEDQTLHREMVNALASAFTLLSERCQELLRRSFARGESYRAVSDSMQLPMGTIGPTRSRCLTDLRRALAGATYAN
jgi:RNA polymerase sigma factor (sigma-70 family)